MATSEHDRQVLREFEKDLLSEGQISRPSLFRRRTVGTALALTGLAVGLVVLFAGLSLASAVGTVVGVAGSLILVASAWFLVHNVSPWLSRRTKAGRGNPKP
jgi:hypothetical protein